MVVKKLVLDPAILEPYIKGKDERYQPRVE